MHQQQYESQQNDPHQNESQKEESQWNGVRLNHSQQGELQKDEMQNQSQATGITNMPPERETLPEECTICLCFYNEHEQRPRTLPCGHTFCSLCVSTLLKEGHFSCPSCLTEHHATDASHFPVNYALESMIIRFKTLQAKEPPLATAETTQVLDGKTKQNGKAGLGRRLQLVIKEQKESMETLRATLQQELNQLEQYRVKLSLSLAKHGHLLEELDRVGQQHRKAMKLLMEEDLRVEAFMEEGEKDQRDLNAAKDQLDSVTSAQKAYPIIDVADDSALVVEEWLQHSKEEFPNGVAYSTSCRLLERTEAALQVASESEDTTESITSGHPVCAILDVVKKIQERSVGHVKLHIRKKLGKTLESGLVSAFNREGYNRFSFPAMTGEDDKTSPGTFTFKFTSSDSSAVFPSPKVEAPSPTSSVSQGLCHRIPGNWFRKHHHPSRKKDIMQPFSTPTTTAATTNTNTNTNTTSTTITSSLFSNDDDDL